MAFLQGVMHEPWLDVPATHELMTLRCCEIHEIEKGKIVESHVLIDTLDFLNQAGYWPIAPRLGTEAPWPSPLTGDGVSHSRPRAVRRRGPGEHGARALLGARFYVVRAVRHWHQQRAVGF